MIRASDVPELADLDPKGRKQVWRSAVAMALRRPALPLFLIGYSALTVVVLDQVDRFHGRSALLFAVIAILASAFGFTYGIIKILRPYFEKARRSLSI